MPRRRTLYRLPAAPGARTAVAWRMAGALLLGLANGGWAATSSIAWHLRYAPSLGRPWLVRPWYPDRLCLALFLVLAAAAAALGLQARWRPAAALLVPGSLPVLLAAIGPLYNPLHALTWLHRYGHAAPLRDIVAGGEIVGLVALGGSVLAALVHGLASFARLQRIGDLYGSGHWATTAEVAAAGLVCGDASGMVVGSLGRRALVDPLDRHALVFAPSGTGKSTCLVVPTLLRWRDSVLALDIKAELWQLTAGYRQAQGQPCIRFDPTLPKGSASYNPILAIPRSEEDVAYAQDVADILVNPEGRERAGGERFFEEAARALLAGVILHVLYTEVTPSLGACLQLLSSPQPEVTWKAMAAAVHDPQAARGWTDRQGEPTVTHPAVANAAGRLLGMDFRTASGVQATALAALSLFEDPVVVRNTTGSDFRAEDLIDGTQAVSVYLTVAPSNLDRMRPLLRIVLNQLTRHLTREVRRDRRPVLYMLDEFTALGRLDHLERALAFLRGYGIRVFLSIQSLEQLSQIYGQHQSLAANCGVHVAFGANDLPTAKLLSEMTGSRTVEYRRQSLQGSLLGSRRSENETEAGRPLLSPDEVRRLPPGEALIYVAGCAPILGRRLPYWRDPVLAQRASVPPPERSDRVVQNHHPGAAR